MFHYLDLELYAVLSLKENASAKKKASSFEPAERLCLIVNEGWRLLEFYGKIVGAGEVSEWLKEHAWKACRVARLSQVRILFSPPFFVTEGSMREHRFFFCVHAILVLVRL